MLTSYKEFNIAKRALYNWALDYILKNAPSKDVFAGIETVSKANNFYVKK